MARLGEFKNTQRELYRFQLRLGIAGAMVVVAFAILLGRFFYLQVVQHQYYQTKAEDNRISIVPIPPNRGNILDRNGIVLARSFSAYTLEISPEQVPDMAATIRRLKKLINLRPSDLSRFRRLLAESKRDSSVPIKTRLSDREVARFVANSYRFPGVKINARLFRRYPLGKLAAHALGYLGRINARDLKRIEAEGVAANYKGTDEIGKTGLEQSYERQLHGITGYAQVEVDAAGRAVRTLSRTPPVPGDNLVLTLDAHLQKVAEDAFDGRRGALVAIDPNTGGVLAFVSEPSFDPNLFVDGIDTANWKRLNNSADKPLNDRALTGVYPPGSTFKPYMALAALELGKRTPKQTIVDPGYFMFGGHRFRDDKPGGHGVVDMYKAIVVSCDTYFYTLANDMGIDAISSFMRRFDFGSRTGIDLEGEATGVLPSREWKRKHFRLPEQQKWYPGETISVGIGQGYNAYTPLQLAHALSILANGGIVYKPHLVNYIVDSRTGKRIYIDREPVRTLKLNPRYVAFVRNAMVGVNKKGTGRRAFAGAEYTSGGKTGTAQLVGMKPNERYIASRMPERLRDDALFIAFAPAESPKIVVAVVVENGGHGATAAAPIARKVLDYYLLGKWPQSTPKSAAAHGAKR